MGNEERQAGKQKNKHEVLKKEAKSVKQKVVEMENRKKRNNIIILIPEE